MLEVEGGLFPGCRLAVNECADVTQREEEEQEKQPEYRPAIQNGDVHNGFHDDFGATNKQYVTFHFYLF